MSSGIKVTPEQLQALGGQTSKANGEIGATLGSLTGQLAPLHGQDWSGQASAQFQALWEQWHSGAKQVGAALEGIAGLLRSAGSSYAQAEQQIASSFH